MCECVSVCGAHEFEFLKSVCISGMLYCVHMCKNVKVCFHLLSQSPPFSLYSLAFDNVLDIRR